MKFSTEKGRLGVIPAGLFRFLLAEPRGSWLLCPSPRKLSFCGSLFHRLICGGFFRR
ncbi:hypothetical protein CLOLEP_00558 [[Clostridium] leptum DSM 753]|uniref:Uncharacterized protein n=1 Tax=[Clostridium] leptum DSM 753 TaxID=428125 RepID=A7VPT1_9FIRM|nr:hypothetical protein CLOLEP_00558 [[Clostridium] leptum DSM 753]